VPSSGGGVCEVGGERSKGWADVVTRVFYFLVVELCRMFAKF
jgi:hypothetical protein